MLILAAARAATRRHGGAHLVGRANKKRGIQTATVTDGAIQQLASKPLHALTLADLCSHGRPPLSTEQLLKSANFTLSILPSRLAHRIQSLRALPYIVVANPNVSQIHNNYVHSLSTLLPYAERHIETLQDEIKFTEVMADLVETHSNTIAVLARGFLEARKYISAEQITRFLDEHLRARIGTRLIAEQHIALHFSSKAHAELSDHHETTEQSSYIGVIDTALKPAEIIRRCEATVGEICELKYGVRPTVVLSGDPETTIAHIPMHLEYILTELLKNSFRATIEAGMEKEPIDITIAPAPENEDWRAEQKRAMEKGSSAINSVADHDTSTADAASNTKLPPGASANIQPLDCSSPGVTIRIRDRGGGISPENHTKLWEYGFTTFNEDEINDKTSGTDAGPSALDMLSAGAAGGSSLAGLGYGLPLGRAYAGYFGGGIAVQSLFGWGTDVYLSLRGVGKIN
ncbi:hypothetical protein B0A48_11781 [Cryoendolithus antarcticus]|uniref:Protein-serine/threonine kinase n=1 Tax=Cryoendolithus antarcticus TaxID=1507870 RepID=A0A1V8SSQ9_9PEZI|nr:hypothetical protein B0A48_11781 [Cryoendolithus antarcticus]